MQWYIGSYEKFYKFQPDRATVGRRAKFEHNRTLSFHVKMACFFSILRLIDKNDDLRVSLFFL